SAMRLSSLAPTIVGTPFQTRMPRNTSIAIETQTVASMPNAFGAACASPAASARMMIRLAMEHRLHRRLGVCCSYLCARQLRDKVAGCFDRYRFDLSHRRFARRGNVRLCERKLFAKLHVDLCETFFGIARGLALGIGNRLLRRGAARLGLLAIAFFERIRSGMGSLGRCQIVRHLAVACVHRRFDLGQHAAADHDINAGEYDQQPEKLRSKVPIVSGELGYLGHERRTLNCLKIRNEADPAGPASLNRRTQTTKSRIIATTNARRDRKSVV